MTPRLLLVLCLAVFMLHPFPLPARAQASGGSGSQPGFTLKANSRVVLTDVTVTDKQGNPVPGLKASDFQVFDNKKPQEIASFEEHRRDDATTPQPVSAPGVYSNDYLAHPPRALNVVFLDLTNIEIEDQLYLSYQLGKFFDALRPEDPVAVYARTGGASILLQGFTSDRALLRAATRKIMPRFPAFGREYLDDFQTLRQMELYLGQIPGRKNVLWFSGGSTFYLRPDASELSLQSGWRSVYDELETQRIAIYPIDARGLTIKGSPRMLAQHAVMSNVAEATGGRAVYDYNGLALAAGQIVHDDGEYYTLTYAPHDFRYDNKWHKVSVTMPGTYYTLSYRRGYYADGNPPAEQQPRRPRTRLLASGETAKDMPTSSKPIIFQASVSKGVVAAAPNATSDAPSKKRRKGTAPFTVQYALPLDAFEVKSVNGKPTVQCAAVVIAFNDNGTMIAHHAQEVTFSLTGEAAAHPAGKSLPVDLEIDLAKGDVYLYVAAWDITSKRLGTLEIPYQVDAMKAPQDPHASK
ncbi:MAG TPA: VWA domain-containing protein [Acidobacteriaceae bacterium]|nr:VWA domain-containing protein [Acidobacteriaceae bacterium]